MEDTTERPPLDLLDRLDALKGYLSEERRRAERLGPGSRRRRAELDAHLATLDDAMEALQS